ncbi:hypothetical protein E2C01_001649 [Portunus trituberculatus]|uniref:Uncharacterized protein n=1 Tax=Portunus trituberculatus TaxID=210409 RepID=A0A5B7CHQ7_PORTR|nr:hypothetical protein [Portunus trituberculatus]
MRGEQRRPRIKPFEIAEVKHKCSRIRAGKEGAAQSLPSPSPLPQLGATSIGGRRERKVLGKEARKVKSVTNLCWQGED